MIPKEYLAVKSQQDAVIAVARRIIEEAYDEAHKSKMPKNVRPATSKDIIEGNIIWHQREAKYGAPYWNIIEDVIRPNDLFKAYCADDGCRYGLDGAYVEPG